MAWREGALSRREHFLGFVIFVGVAWTAAAVFLGLLLGFPVLSKAVEAVTYLGITLAVGVVAGSVPCASY